MATDMLLLLLLLTPNEILKRTENRVLLSVSDALPPGTAISDRTPTVEIARFLLTTLWPPSARICQTLRILSNEIE